MNTTITISNTNEQTIATELSKLLADETVLYIKTRNAHWNIEGADFYDKHLFFEIQFKQLDIIIDSVAEHIRSMNHYAPATLKSYLSLTRLTEATHEKNTSAGFMKALLIDHESICNFLLEHKQALTNKLHALETIDFISALMATHKKMAWFLRAHLKN
jgi:starvation-inducible DNA-binding protein